MKIQPIKQPNENVCGPTAIKMVADYFDMEISSKKISKISKYKERDGMSNIDLANTLNKIGLKTEVIASSSWEQLISLNTKDRVIIVSWMLDGYIGHFSVVDSVSKTHIFLAEPVSGKIKKIERLTFMRLWFDYDDIWFPDKNTDIQLRWMVVTSKSKIRGLTFQ